MIILIIIIIMMMIVMIMIMMMMIIMISRKSITWSADPSASLVIGQQSHRGR